MKVTPKLIIASLLGAFVAAITLFIRIPIPKSSGYLNLGDVIIIFTGLYLGPMYGFVVGGIGSSIADAFGYPIFIVPTFFIKGFEGLLSGVIKKPGLRWLGAVAGAIVMVTGYYAAEAFIFSGKIGRAAAITELPFNIIQGAVGVIGGTLLAKAIRQLTEGERND